MKNSFPLIVDNPSAAIPISFELAKEFGFEKDDKRLDSKHFGPWQICTSVSGLCISKEFDDSKGYTVTKRFVLIGKRAMHKLRESGYELEGVLSVNGKKVHGFTSSQLFQLPDGNLRSVGVIFACGVAKEIK